MSFFYRVYDIARDFYQETFVYTDLHAPRQDLSGKVILITGTNAGLGRESVRQLALMRPAKIIMTARNMERGERARREIEQQTGYEGLVLEHLDLCSMESINALSRKLLKSEKRLDVLMCNAGLGGLPETARRTQDGFDEMFQGNNLGHFLLARNLLPLLEGAGAADKAGTPTIARVIFLSSLASKFAFSFDLQSYSNSRRVSANEYYPVSKLMAVLMANGLAERYKTKSIVVNSCHPGTVRTEFADKYPDFMKNYVFPTIYKLLGRPLEQGAATQVYLASAPEASQSSAKYWSNMRVTPMNPTAENMQLCGQFVNLCDELVSKYSL